MTGSTYERDFYSWVEEQWVRLRDHDGARLDWEHLREELGASGRQEFRELVSLLAVLLGHLLTGELQPERRSRCWWLSVCEQRRAIARLLSQNPSLEPKLPEAPVDGYQGGVALALRQTDLLLQQLQAACLWNLEAALAAGTVGDASGDWSDPGL